MKKHFKWSVLFLILSFPKVFSLINNDGHYFISAPTVIRPGIQYNVAISTTVASSVVMGISGSSYRDFKTVELEPSISKIVKFEIPLNLTEGKYNLKANGISGLEFANQTTLYFQKHNYLILVQTDKPIYKPGDKVRFRVIILDSTTKPTEVRGPVSVVIYDKELNIVKKFKDIQLTKGVFTAELQISDQVILGQWKIFVHANGQIVDKTFKIQEQILPKFEVNIEIPRYISKPDGKINLALRAKYAFGRSVKGQARISLYSGHQNPTTISFDSRRNLIRPPIATKTLAINGNAYVDFDIPPSIPQFNDVPDPFYLEALVRDNSTGKIESGVENIKIHARNYKIILVEAPYSYNLGQPFRVTIKLQDLSGAPLQDKENPVYVYWDQSYAGVSFIPRNATREFFNDNGYYTKTLTISDNSQGSYYTIFVNYKGRNKYLKTVVSHSTLLVEPLHIRILNKKCFLNQQIFVEVAALRDMNYFIYQVVGLGNVWISEYVEVQHSRVHTFRFMPTIDMIPHITIFVYFIEGGKLYYDERSIYFQDELPNSITFHVPHEVNPRDNATITIETAPNSLIGLMAVDSKVHLLGEDNDINPSHVLSNIFDSYLYVSNEIGVGNYPGKASGLKTLTNANYFYIPDPYSTAEQQAPQNNDRFIFLYDNEQVSPPIKTEFPDTWIWESFETNDSETTTITRTIPDITTSWVVTAFAINQEKGLALTKRPGILNVFRPFSLSTNLPYSIKKSEVISVPVIIYNYKGESLTADVKLINEYGEFDFARNRRDIANATFRSKTVTIAPKTGETVLFTIKPKKIGLITIKIAVNSSEIVDNLVEMLLVESEGVTQYKHKTVLVNLRDRIEQTDDISVIVPQLVSPGSLYIEISVVGDILGPVIQNLGDLVRMPYGCGEQNMIYLVPSILVLKYLEITNRDVPEIKSKAMHFSQIGYQRQLTYKHHDGSFSSFGGSGKDGSVWLSAFVAKSFRQANSYIDIDKNIIISALDYLAKHQKVNGTFYDPSPKIIRENYDYDDKGVHLTAFVLLAFIENMSILPQHHQVINKSLEYIAQNVNESSDTYSIALSAYVLQLANHDSKDSFVRMLENRAVLNVDKKWWNDQVNNINSNSWHYSTNADVQITSYALLALLEAKPDIDHSSIVNWLISQRDEIGGFGSTQNTILALEAIVKFAEKSMPIDRNLTVNIDNGNSSSFKIHVNNENTLVYQTQKLPSTTRNVKIVSSGNGTAFVQIAYKFNSNIPERLPRFILEPSVTEISNSKDFQLSVCTRFVPSPGESKLTGMALMEINFPSGFTVDPDSVALLKEINHIKRIETRNKHSIAIIYFDSLDENKICLSVKAHISYQVAEQKPASVAVYDYYNDVRFARIFYFSPSLTICDICDDCMFCVP